MKGDVLSTFSTMAAMGFWSLEYRNGEKVGMFGNGGGREKLVVVRAEWSFNGQTFFSFPLVFLGNQAQKNKDLNTGIFSV